MNEDQLYNMSDEELEKAFFSAKENLGSSGDEDSSSLQENQNDLENLDNSQDSDLASESDDSNDTSSDNSSADNLPIDDQDGNEDSADEQQEDLAAKDEPNSQPAQKLKYRANGKDYEFTSDEIMQQFPKVFGQAMDYTRKMQAIKPWRQTIDAIEEAKLNHNDVSLMIDVLKGDKAAIAELLKRTGVDALEVEGTKESYVPKSYGRDEGTLAIKDIVDEISQDQEYQKTYKVLSNDWDNNSWAEISKNPEMIKLLHIDVKSGVFDKVQPIAEKLKLFDGSSKSDLDYYKLGAQEYFKELAAQNAAQAKPPEQPDRVAQVRKEEASRKATEQAAAKRRAAAPTKPGISKPQGVSDYLDDSDEAFNEWYKNLKDNM